MLETKIFTENPFKLLKLIGILFGIFILLMNFILFLVQKPQITDDGLNKSAAGIVIWWIIFICVLLVLFLMCSFESKKTLKCDFNRCQILIAKFCFWQSPRHLNEFKWSEVTDTNIVKIEEESFTEGGGIINHYTFVVQTKDGASDLMNLKMSSKDNIQGLISYVNEAAQQTKYIWVKDAEIENRLVIDSNYGYSKVARNN